MLNQDLIIKETIESYLATELLSEAAPAKGKKYWKKAIKGKGGSRKDLDIDDEKKYNTNVDDKEQGEVENVLNSDFINKKKVAEKLYPDHTPEGAQSQLNKKLTHAKSDSGSTYRLKKKEVRRLRKIIASFI